MPTVESSDVNLLFWDLSIVWLFCLLSSTCVWIEVVAEYITYSFMYFYFITSIYLYCSFEILIVCLEWVLMLNKVVKWVRG